MNISGPILPFVITAGLLDSINPCAIAILLIFIALLFTLKKNRSTILMMGFFYIAAVFVTYLAIGLGMLKVMNLFQVPHLVVKVLAGLVILVGLIGLKDYFFPAKFQILAIPLKARQFIANFATRATLPAAIIVGVLVAITEFPCSGAVYLATLGLISAKVTFIKGMGYLIVYNLMFVVPLIVILILASNRLVVEKVITSNEINSSKIRLFSALVMIAIGLVIWIWFT